MPFYPVLVKREGGGAGIRREELAECHSTHTYGLVLRSNLDLDTKRESTALEVDIVFCDRSVGAINMFKAD